MTSMCVWTLPEQSPKEFVSIGPTPTEGFYTLDMDMAASMDLAATILLADQCMTCLHPVAKVLGHYLQRPVNGNDNSDNMQLFD